MRTENLAVMLTDMKGFTAATSRQSRAENARMLALQDMILLPVVRAFGGKRVKTIGDAYLVLFDAPTAGLLCGMAIQDRLWDYRRRVPADERIEVRVVLSLGEVRLVGNGAVPQDVYGEAVNLAARVEQEAEAGEIWFTEAVQLVANRAEVHAEDIGARSIKGIDEDVRLYRVARVASASEPRPPYGNVALSRVLGLDPPEPARLARAIRRRENPLYRAVYGAAETAARISPRVAAAVLIVALAIGGAVWWVTTATERLIDRGDFSAAQASIDERADEVGEDDPEVLFLRGRLADARARAGKGSARYAFQLWSHAVSVGSRDALEVLEKETRAWECDRRRLAARALADSGSPRTLDVLYALSEAEPEAKGAVSRFKRLLGSDGYCGTGDIAREGIGEIEAAE